LASLGAVEITKGFSGREISKLMIAIQGDLYGSRDGKLGLEEVISSLRRKAVEHVEKANMVARSTTK